MRRPEYVPASSPRAARRYRVGPALVALCAVLAFVGIIVLAAVAGIKLAESSEVRPHFVTNTPQPSPGPCPRRGGPPPC